MTFIAAKIVLLFDFMMLLAHYLPALERFAANKKPIAIAATIF